MLDAAFWEELERKSALKYDHMKITEKEDGRITAELRLLPEYRDQYACLHSDVLYTLSDTVAGYAAAADGQSYIPQSSSVHIMKNTTRDRFLRALATVSRRADRTVLVDVMAADEHGRVLATGRYTFCAAGKVSLPCE